jgi:hypothetical protein
MCAPFITFSLGCSIFKDEVYAALQSIKDKFHFHFIMADGSPDDVAARIRQVRGNAAAGISLSQPALPAALTTGLTFLLLWMSLLWMSLPALSAPAGVPIPGGARSGR